MSIHRACFAMVYNPHEGFIGVQQQELAHL